MLHQDIKTEEHQFQNEQTMSRFDMFYQGHDRPRQRDSGALTTNETWSDILTKLIQYLAFNSYNQTSWGAP